MKQCENCGKEHDGSFASGRFCSKHCSRSFSTKNMSEESKRRKSESASKAAKLAFKEGRNKGWNLSKESREKAKETTRAYFKTDAGKEHIKKWIVASQTEEAVRKRAKTLSDVASNKKLKGEKWGWDFSRRGVESYPEKYWRGVLENHSIAFNQEHKVLHKDVGINDNYCFFLDFLVNDNVDIEIDGSQHKNQIEQDRIRDDALISSGYIVYRIPWVNPAHDKQRVDKQIEDLLLFLK